MLLRAHDTHLGPRNIGQSTNMVLKILLVVVFKLNKQFSLGKYLDGHEIMSINTHTKIHLTI